MSAAGRKRWWGTAALWFGLFAVACGRCGGDATPDEVEPSSVEQPEPSEPSVEESVEPPSEFVAHYVAESGAEAGVAGALLVRWAQSCEAGEGVACRWLADVSLYGRWSDGRDVVEGPVELFRALQLYQRGCFAGDGWSCLELAAIYARGDGVPENETIAEGLREDAVIRLWERCSGGALEACVQRGVVLSELGRRDEAVEVWRAICTDGAVAGCRWWHGETGSAEAWQAFVALCAEQPEWPTCEVSERESAGIEALVSAWRERCDRRDDGTSCRLLVALGADESSLERRVAAGCPAAGCPEVFPDRLRRVLGQGR